MITNARPSRAPALSTRRRVTAVLAAVLAIGTFAATASPAIATPARRSPLQISARKAVAAGAVGYVARVNDGRHVTTAVAGLADRSTRRRLRPTDEFEIGSNTKTFMATLTLQLVSRGKLKLTDTVEQHLPGVVPNGDHITLRMLLNHTSGLFNYTDDPALAQAMAGDINHGFTPAELVAMATKHEPSFAPGKSWSYSNTNYILVGMILQEVTGQSPARLVQRRIARPLHLRHTYLLESSAKDTGPGYAHGYMIAFGEPGTPPQYTDVSDMNLAGWANTAGAMISTPAELSRFFSALLRGKLLPPAQLAQMKTTVPLPGSGESQSGYGLGLARSDTPCGTYWGHGGNTLGHGSTALVSPDGRRSVVADVTTQLDPRVKPGKRAVAWQEAIGIANLTAICAMHGKAVPASMTKAAA